MKLFAVNCVVHHQIEGKTGWQNMLFGVICANVDEANALCVADCEKLHPGCKVGEIICLEIPEATIRKVIGFPDECQCETGEWVRIEQVCKEFTPSQLVNSLCCKCQHHVDCHKGIKGE